MTHARILHTSADTLLDSLPDAGVHLILTDPPYNIGKADWDKIDGYVPWLGSIFQKAVRVCTPNATLIFWHNDWPQLSALHTWLEANTPWRWRNTITCYKPFFRPIAWNTPGNTLRSWYNICEYIMVYTMLDPLPDQIYSIPEFSEELRAYFCGELARAELTPASLAEHYHAWGAGGTGAVLSHYFGRAQYMLPVREVYEAFFQRHLPAAVGLPDLYARPYDELKAIFDRQTEKYKATLPVHNTDLGHCNAWLWDEMNDGSLHPCAKPVPLLSRLIRTHSRPGDTVLDMFAGSGSTLVAALESGRHAVGSELDKRYHAIAARRIAQTTPSLPGLE